MRTARALGLSPDGSNLIVVLDGGEQVAIPADDRLRAALRNDRARMGQLEIEMESALRPRDIQARIRSGESLEAVAQAAGVPPEQIEPFAAPVIAEREHIAGLAQANPVRRAGDAVAHRSLRAVVTDRLLSRGVDADAIDWDAWRSGERRWTIRLSYESGSAHRQADFEYDQTGRFSVAANEDARWLTGEHSSSHGPQPHRKRRGDDPNDDQTLDINDELAIVRAIQPQFAVTPDIDDEDDFDDERLGDGEGTPDNEDAFAEGDLAEVDGVYDIVPGDRSNMDVLYDMLAGFDEDSVQIYAGLVRPDPETPAAPALHDGPEQPDLVIVETVDVIEIDVEASPEAEDVNDEDELFAQAQVEHLPHADEPPNADMLDEEDLDVEVVAELAVAEPEVLALLEPAGAAEDAPPESNAPATEAEHDAERAEPDDERAEPDAEPANDTDTEQAEPIAPTEDNGDAAAADPDFSEAPSPQAPAQRPSGRRKPAVQPVTEPEQPSLVEEAANEPSRPIKRKRASVPSWDEIMFGAPTPKPKN